MPITGYGPPYGSGTSSAAPSSGGGFLRNPYTGASSGSRFIHPVTKDYLLDANGRVLGMGDVQQLVLIAVSTEKGSSAVRELGQELKLIQRISSNFARRVADTLVGAVQHLIDLGLVAVLDVVVDKIPNRPGGAIARLRWRDLTVPLNSPFADQETSVGG